jgi:hypothetical protein
MLRNNPLGSILVCVLFLLALLSCWLAVHYHFSTDEAYGLNHRYQEVLRTTDAMQRLVNDTLEYSRNNPDIHPLLQQFNLKPRPATGPAPAPTPAQPAPRTAR